MKRAGPEENNCVFIFQITILYIDDRYTYIKYINLRTTICLRVANILSRSKISWEILRGIFKLLFFFSEKNVWEHDILRFYTVIDFCTKNTNKK
jgi:hypothetical protein